MAVDIFTPEPTVSETRTPTRVPTLTQTPTQEMQQVITSEIDGMQMVFVPAGEFIMGSEDGAGDESPVHTVYLDAYWIDLTEVTNDQYRMCVEAGACDYSGDTRHFRNLNSNDHPVVWVDWYDANDYCQWAGRELPTEAQWEKATRGTDGRTYPWGEGVDCSLVNFGECNNNTKTSQTSPVGTFLNGASPYGAPDMAGNVWEWTADWYYEDYYALAPMDNPTGPESGVYRVMRGGSWSSSGEYVRSAVRGTFIFTNYKTYIVGFRCAQSAVSP